MRDAAYLAPSLFAGCCHLGMYNGAAETTRAISTVFLPASCRMSTKYWYERLMIRKITSSTKRNSSEGIDHRRRRRRRHLYYSVM